MKRIKYVVSYFLVVMIMVFGGCQTKEQQKVVTEEPLEATEELFLYEGTTTESKAITVDEEGVYPVFIQQFKVYDLEGNCVKEVELELGNGDINFLTAKGELLYCIVMKSDFTSYMPTLYTIHTKTWEVTEVCGFDDYIFIFNFIEIDDYFYVFGQLKEPEQKEYELNPKVSDYIYSGEAVCRVKIGEKEVEWLDIDFPIDIVKTKDNTVLIYHYDEENGFGFLEFHPKEEWIAQVGWTAKKVQADFFTGCEDGFLFYENGRILYGTVDGGEGTLSRENIFLNNVPTYQRGFLFYTLGEGVERMGISNLIKSNTPLHLLTHEMALVKPYDSGYLLKQKEVDLETYALKVLAQDVDFDMYLLNSTSSISYNIKEKGVFYPLNEVEGVKEYLDVCFPYIKEIATTKNGEVWMVPVSTSIATLVYDKEYCKEKEVDLSKMNLEQFLILVEEVEKNVPEQGSISTYLIVDELFKQYLSSYDTFDTEIFRNYAKQIRLLYEELGSISKSRANIISVIPAINMDKEHYCTKEQLDAIPNFFYEYNSHVSQLFNFYAERLGEADVFGISGVPRIVEEGGNVGFVTFLAVNPQSEHLDIVLDYISAFCKHMITQKDTFLLEDASMYTNTPFIKEAYEVYKDGALFFSMDDDVYWNPFWSYMEGEMELEQMIEEMERKRAIYVGE